MLLICAGVALLATDYAWLPGQSLEYLLYWVALGLAYVGVVLFATVGRSGPGCHLAALAAFGAVTWLPYILRSPNTLLFVDERYHLDVLTRLAEAGHTPLAVTLFPLPGTYPGIENVALGVMALTGLQVVDATRVVTLAIHITIPMLAYLVARGVGLPRAAGFTAALIYAANTSFLFFHAIFSYESLGILLFLAAWATIALYRSPGDRLDDRKRVNGLLLVLIPVFGGLAVTHHLTSYLLAVTLFLAWLAARRARAPEARAFGIATLVATAFAVTWFMVSFARVEPYLGGTLSSRADAIVRTLLLERSQPRSLFANSDIPLFERAVAFAYPPLVLVLGGGGLVLVWRRARARGASLRRGAEIAPLGILWSALALAGPLGWAATAPAVLTQAGEVAYRSWPFLFLGIGVFGAFFLVELARRFRRPRIGQAVTFGLIGVILMGGFSIGDNQAGRFPSSSPATASGSGNVTSEVSAAAAWLLATAGPNNLIDSDNSTSTVFGTEGRQRVLLWQAWFPFVAHSADAILQFLAVNGVGYLIVDRQISDLPPRYGSYFGQPDIPSAEDPGQPFPATLLGRLDTVSGLDRVYDSGRIVIYERRDRSRVSASPGPTPGSTP